MLCESAEFVSTCALCGTLMPAALSLHLRDLRCPSRGRPEVEAAGGSWKFRCHSSYLASYHVTLPHGPQHLELMNHEDGSGRATDIGVWHLDLGYLNFER